MPEKSIADGKILIVEDNLLLSEVHKRLIEKMGYTVLGQTDKAEAAIADVKKLKPDLILMDIQLSGKMDGIEAVQKINKELNIPVIYLSGSSSKKLKKKAMATRCCDYLVKPVQGKDLKKAFKKAFAAD